MTTVRLNSPNSSIGDYDAVTINQRGVTVALPGDGTINTSAAVVGANITNPGYSGVNLHLDVTVAASSGASTLVFHVQALDTVTSAFYNLPGASFEALATSTTQETVYIHPMTVSDSGAGFNRTPMLLPGTWRITSSGGTFSSGASGSTYTFTISGTYVI